MTNTDNRKKPNNLLRQSLNLAVTTALLSVAVSITGCATALQSGNTQGGVSHALTRDMPQIDRQGRIAYVEEQGSGNNKHSALYTIHPNGSKRTLLTSVNGYIYAPTWSSDGSKLAYSVQKSKSYPFIYIYDVASKTVRQVVNSAGSNLSPSFSPDGTKLLYSSSVNGNADIYELDLTTGNTVQVTTLPSTEVQPSYAPDGKSFVYVSDKTRAGSPQLYRYDFASKQAVKIGAGRYAASPQLSLDGSKIGFLNGRQAAVLNVATGQIINLAENGLDEPARLSPSGQYVVYPMAYGRGQGGSLVIRSLGAGSSYTISSKSGAQVRAPVWGR